jgi:two-component system sensor histidine kinase KdpD
VRLSGLQRLISEHGLLWTLASVLVATAAFLPFRTLLGSEQWGWPYLLVVGTVAGTSGVWLAVLSAILAFFAWNFLFIQPYYTLHVDQTGDLIHLFAFLVVAIAVGMQTGRLRESSEAARRQASRTAALNRLSSDMVRGILPTEMAAGADEELRRVLGVEGAAVWVRPTGDREPLMPLEGSSGTAMNDATRDVVKRVLSRPDGPDTIAAADSTFLRLATTSGDEGVLQVLGRTGLDEEDHLFATSVAHLAAVYLQNRHMAAVAMRASASEEAEKLRTALVSSVSHELKTPLASLTASVTDLMARDEPPSPLELGESLSAMSDDLSRLDHSIGNLLDASRLEANAWKPAPTQFDVGELIGSVCSQLSRSSRTRLVFAVPEGLPPMHADFVQVSRALAQLIDNALQYSSGEVTLGADVAEPGLVRTWVADSGPGIPETERGRIFERFFRGTAGRQSRSSTGLGLSLAHEIVRANGGRIDLESVAPHGARFVIVLPAAPGVPDAHGFVANEESA